MPAWTFPSRPLSPGTRSFAVADAQGRRLTRAEALTAMASDASFRAAMATALAQAPYDAFFWEMPATSRAHQDRECAWVLVDAPTLTHLRADRTAFARPFAAAPNEHVVTFPNLGGDAVLVVPTPRAPDAAYAHLAAFVRQAPSAQVDALFATIARAILARLEDAPLWVSTAGLGVSWLHVRLDDRPKYYRHEPFKRTP